MSQRESFFFYIFFSACDTSKTCTGKEKECEGDVCKCKSGFKEDPEIAKPNGTDDCVAGMYSGVQISW